jgi:methylated-DNA-[protein]-cysteine S-methyltransferase
MNALVFKTRLGWMAAASDEDGITNVLLPHNDETVIRKRLKELTGEKTKSCKELKRLQSDFVRLFSGEKVDFGKYMISPRNQTLFRRYVWSAARKIPQGATVTYGDLAQLAGFPQAARAVGGALNSNPVPIIVPCHRVVSRGGLGGFAGGADLKKELLELEGALA